MSDTSRRTLDEHERRRARRAIVRSALRATVLAVLVLAAYYAAPVRGGSQPGILLRILAVGSASVLVVAWEIRAVAKAEFPRIRAIDALVGSVSVMVITFAIIYLNFSADDPAAFTEELEKTSSLYFTMTTLTTVGYGDIAAKTDGARIAVMIQMVFNVAVIGTTVRAILGTAKKRSQSRSAPRP
jgi:hypothetical protein